MRLDNSALNAWRFCGLKWYERYEAEVPDVLLSEVQEARQPGRPVPGADVPELCVRRGIASIAPAPARDFGTRFHQLVANHRRALSGQPQVEYPEWPEEDIELEARATFAQYLAAYPEEPYQFLSIERTEHVPIPGTEHECTIRADSIVRFDDGTIGPLDVKTERHGSRANSREAWVGRTQAALYLWACARLYPQETVSRMVVDVVTRGTPKFPPSFRRMDDISQSPEQLDDAVRNVVQVAEEIARCREIGWYPSNKNLCVDAFGQRCEYMPLHILGRTDANLRLFRPAEDYLAD